MNKIIKTTDDGSHTIINTDIQEHYHSTYGAISESKHIFIESALYYYLNNFKKKNISILEIGFGTGLNALLTQQELLAKKTYCVYHSYETNILEEDIYKSLNYPKILNIDPAIFYLMHLSPWNKNIPINPFFKLNKILCKIEDAVIEENYFDIVYFDAFSPNVQPELWTENIFKKIYYSMKKNAVFATYSTKGTVKKALINNGFLIEKIPGPLGKREILRAVK